MLVREFMNPVGLVAVSSFDAAVLRIRIYSVALSNLQ